MPEVRLTLQADRDLLDIFVFGLQTFGTRQAERYAATLDHCFQLLAENPRMGRSAPTLGPQVRRHEHESHVILYEATELGILVLAVVHKQVLLRLRSV